MIFFETPHNQLKCVLSIKETNSNAKMGKKISHLLMIRAEGADPPPLYSQPDRKKTVF